MTKSDRASIKNEETYDALREDGYSKEASARIANAQENDDMDPSAKGGSAPPYEGWTKKDLYNRAAALDVKGRSSMAKDELITALRNKRRD
ncbi:MAG: Rho termination factor [Pseudomonadota bacterium]